MRISNPTAKKGEDIAYIFLKKQGYKIIDRNWRKGYGEIDLIAIENGCLVFIEVKTRSSDLFGTPQEAITYFKLRSLEKTALFYKKLHPNLPDSLRIDAVSIMLDPSNINHKIELIKSITS